MGNKLTDLLHGRRGLIAVAAAALLAGIGFTLSRPSGPGAGKPDQPIQWHKVQAVPTRAPDAEDRAWQERSDALDRPATPPADPDENQAATAAAGENAGQ